MRPPPPPEPDVDIDVVVEETGEADIDIDMDDEGVTRLVIRRDDVEEWVTDIPASARLKVDKGDRVEVGTQLTEGSKNPREVLRIQGREAVRTRAISSPSRRRAQRSSSSICA